MKTQEQLYAALMRFCAYRDRCSSEVAQKMDALEVPEHLRDTLFNQLREECFLDDLRFAEQYVSGKFNHKHWGRVKIAYGLFQKGLPKRLIDQALMQIEEEDYQKTINYLIAKQRPKIKAKNAFERSQKLKRYLQHKGYETSYLREV